MRRYRIDVAIPMRDAHALTRAVCRDLNADGRDFDDLWIYDNGSATRSARAWLDTIEETGRYGAEVIRWGPARGLYAMWNHAWRRALDQWRTDPDVPVFLAILNNDITVGPGFLRHLADALVDADDDIWVTYPDWQQGWPADTAVTGELRRTVGTRNLGGMSGYAFMLDVRRADTDGLRFIDEEYIWHSGDGDLVSQIHTHDATPAAVVGLPIGHIENATSREHAWTVTQGLADRRRFRALHGDD